MNDLHHLPLGLTYDDVLITPQASDIEPTDANLTTKISKNITLQIPIVSAPMDRVTEDQMCIKLHQLGGLGILHRNNTIQEQVQLAKIIKKKNARLGAAVGPFDLPRALALDEVGVDAIIIDTAHGHNLNVIKSAEKIKKSIQADLIVGNIATSQAAQDLSSFADGLRVGVGPGATCTTRIITGAGVPQLTAVYEVSQIAKKYNIPVIADGGIRYSGDIVKALIAGASCIMNGSLLAGVDESPGQTITHTDGKKYKEYRGMGSLGAITGTDRYGQEGQSQKAVPEGIEGLTPYRGQLADVIHQLLGGLRAGMGYIGAQTIDQMPHQGKFIRVTAIGKNENHPHSMLKTKKTPNY